MFDFIKKINKNAKISIWGTNCTAQKIYEILKTRRSDVKVKFFIDSYKNGELLNLKIYNPLDFINCINQVDGVIIASYSSRNYLEVILKGLGIKNIIIPTKDDFDDLFQIEPLKWDIKDTLKVFDDNKDKELFGFISNVRMNSFKYSSEIKKYYDNTYKERYNNNVSIKHYFEYIKPDFIKNVVDGGGYEGFSAITFLQNFKNVKNVFVFEPCYQDFKNDLHDIILKNDPRVEIINKGLWDINTTLEFRKETLKMGGSAIVEAKPNIERPHKIIKIETQTIDDFSHNRGVKIDYIKLDVENAEKNVLEGAKNTLIEHRPQLAISIYHSNEHFYTIPIYLKELLKNYKFKLGHYSSCFYDTVLYAIPDELF